MNELANAYNAGDQAEADALFHDEGQVFAPSSIPETGTKQPSPSTWVNAANETNGHLTIEEVCVFRSGDATGSMTRSSAALQRAGVDRLSLHFKVRLTAGTIRQIVIGVSSGSRWDRVCAHYDDQMARADAPCKRRTGPGTLTADSSPDSRDPPISSPSRTLAMKALSAAPTRLDPSQDLSLLIAPSHRVC